MTQRAARASRRQRKLTRALPCVPALPMHSSPSGTNRAPWPRKKMEYTAAVHDVKRVLREHSLRSVCEDAKCPNLSECFSKREATFIILGEKCTRRCGFCAIPAGKPLAPDPLEPARLARAAAEIGLTHIVITSVARDDLDDGGAAHFAACIREIRALSPGTTVEVLTPDFKESHESLQTIAACDLQIFNHNLETSERLHREVRPQGRYDRSLRVLSTFKSMRPDVLTKSGFMLGLGETDDEVYQMMRDLKAHDVDIVTIGQYLQPLANKLDVNAYSTLERFQQFQDFGNELGFRLTLSGPYVRSSFGAAEAARVLGVTHVSAALVNS
jgi:lipoic acid synthetase